MAEGNVISLPNAAIPATAPAPSEIEQHQQRLSLYHQAMRVIESFHFQRTIMGRPLTLDGAVGKVLNLKARVVANHRLSTPQKPEAWLAHYSQMLRLARR